MPKPSEDLFLYHITRLENIPSILQRGLLSRKQIQASQTNFENIANPEILAGRENVRSPRPLSEYVPFHFFPRNPFDYAVCHAYDSKNMAIIAVSRTIAEEFNFPVVTAHPLNYSAPPEIRPYTEGIKRIDWRVLDLEYPDRDYSNKEIKQKCMAECLIPDCVPPDYFAKIYVHDDTAKWKIDKCPYWPCLKTPQQREKCPYSCFSYWTFRWRNIEVNHYMFP